MKLRLLMPGQHLPDVQNAPQEQKFGTDVIIKDVGFYPTAWKWEYEKSIFGDDKGEPDIPNSFENTTRLDWSSNDKSTIFGTTPRITPKKFPKVDRIHDGADAGHGTSFTRVGAREL